MQPNTPMKLAIKPTYLKLLDHKLADYGMSIIKHHRDITTPEYDAIKSFVDHLDYKFRGNMHIVFFLVNKFADHVSGFVFDKTMVMSETSEIMRFNVLLDNEKRMYVGEFTVQNTPQLTLNHVNVFEVV